MTGRGSPKKKRNQRFHHTFPFPAISANKLWITKGRRRFPSGFYNKWKKVFHNHLIENGIVRDHYNFTGNLRLRLIAGFSNKLSDLDNICKAILDQLQEGLGFNDRQIISIEMKKLLVNKGEEFFEVLLTKARENIDKRRR